MVDYTPHNRPGEPGRPHEHVRETTVVRSSNSNGVMAAIVLFILLGIAGFVFWTADENVTANTAAPGAEINEQMAPAPDVDPARPAPAPDAPLIAPDTPAPAETAPAPAIDG